MQDSARHLLYSFARTGESLGEHLWRTIDGIWSGPVALNASRSRITLATNLEVILIELIPWSVFRDRISGSGWKLSSRVEFVENFLAKRFALSLEDVNTSGPLKRGEIADLPLLRMMLEILRILRNPICWEAIEWRVASEKLDFASSRILLQWFREARNSFKFSADLFQWYWWKTWLRCAMATAQAGVNHREECGFSWNLRWGMKQSIPISIHFAISLAA